MMHYGAWLDAAAPDSCRYYDNGYGDLTSMMYTNGHQEQQLQARQGLPAQMRCDEDSEQTGDEAQETGTSCERSSSADIFRLEFAASQWSRLVTNAEGLFNKLMRKNLLPDNEQDQIEQWLCLKQEYEECIGSGDESAPGCAGRRSLERIEEVTETDESGNPGKRRSESDTSEEEEEDEEEEEEEDEEEDEEDAGSENPDFLEKLDDLMRKFKEETDRMIEANKYEFQAVPARIAQLDGKNNNNNDDYVPIVKPIPIRNPNSRRNSMLPGSESCNEVVTFNGNFQRIQRGESHEPDVLVDALRSLEIPEPVKALKNLAANNVAKQSLVRKIQDDLETAQRRIVELQSTIRAKERFIEDMNRNSEVRMSAKEKFQLRRNRLEEEYYNTRSQLAQAENASLRDSSGERSEEGRREIERYRTMAINYEKRLVDIEMIKRIAGDSARKVLELESSLNASRKQMEKLKRQLKREEERKRQLERELADDQTRIRELEDKYNLTASKLREIRDSQEDNNREERHQEISNPHHHHHHHNHQGDHEKKNLLEVSARISHLDQVLKEKSMNLERVTDTDEKEALRHEIRNLRRTRECLIEEKCGLDEKLQKERTLSILEERKLLECGETIEAIDAMIEHKNEMICGRGDLEVERSQREKSERMLSQLEKLSEGEMRTLFDKYFWKVIDLKQSSKNLEIQAAELERHVELQEKRVRALTEALQRTKLEAERRIVELQREQHERIHLMFRHIAEETGASSSHEIVDRNLELARFKRENKTLRRRLADVEALLKPNATNAGPAPRKNLNGPPHIVQQELKKIAPKTKVTRERNKLIIQQTVDSDKRKK